MVYARTIVLQRSEEPMTVLCTGLVAMVTARSYGAHLLRTAAFLHSIRASMILPPLALAI
ncbi:hypothetical protein BDY21DRAFT_353386 [Lineolata rhizophorae]|uniref:Uncharacterized protein n=1 Tax=Lineolata rhizophorae TaxID=578093 RepID=A0A6A6NRU6_9PEZI|nr:hypothetical protein BDY21DRAFT_353386 [Lineolata rhizophorae]